MPTLYTLSESDVAVLKEIVRNYRGKVLGSSGSLPYRSQSASEIYLAYIDSDGIDAVDGTTPGSAICDIYRIDPLTPSIEQVGTDREVFNVGVDNVLEGYAPIVKTKSGAWVVTTGGASSTSYLAYTTTQITARVGTTAGSGTVQPKKLNGTTIESTGSPRTVYSWTERGSGSSGTYVWIEVDQFGTHWWTGEDC
jgi:hypothetical protein